MDDDSSGGERWRDSDGTPQSGSIEYVDRAGNTGVKDGASITWALHVHSDDVVRWRPSRRRAGNMGFR